MNRIKKVFGWVGIGAAAVLLYNACFLVLGNPLGAARAQASELGWEEGDIEVIGGTYSSTLVSWESSLRFRSKSRPEFGEILVEVQRPTPFQRWQLSHYAHGVK